MWREREIQKANEEWELIIRYCERLDQDSG